MFLTPEELAALTGYQQPAYQRRWLAAHGWNYATNSSGRPIVSRAHAESRLSGGSQDSRTWAPNLEAFGGKA